MKQEHHPLDVCGEHNEQGYVMGALQAYVIPALIINTNNPTETVDEYWNAGLKKEALSCLALASLHDDTKSLTRLAAVLADDRHGVTDYRLSSLLYRMIVSKMTNIILQQGVDNMVDEIMQDNSKPNPKRRLH